MANVTIYDVAVAAGVSPKTVSRVINKEPNVRPKMRELVEEKIVALGYGPNTSARSLRSRRSYILGLLYHNPSPAYIIDLQEGALAACNSEGFNLLIHPCNYESKNLVEEVMVLLDQSRVDGLILSPPLSDSKKLIVELNKRNANYVRIAPVDSSGGAPFVRSNDRQAALEMTQHLISLGHTRIGFIVGHIDHAASADRLAGFQDALKSANIRIQKSFVQQGDFSFESGEQCARKLLQKKLRPTAIFASNDYMASGVMKVARQMGIDIPSELSIAGFDDAPVAYQIWPALSTVRQPVHALSSMAAKLLITRVRGQAAPNDEAAMKCELVIRESTSVAPS